MSHECEYCGMECYCDMDDCGGFEQPSNCPHMDPRAGVCDSWEEDEYWDDEIEETA